MKRLADVFGVELAVAAAADRRIWVLDGDLADSDGAIHFAESHPDRFVMAGIAEQNMVSMAAGMASCGLRPFVFSFAAFLAFRAYDQVRVGMSQACQPVTLVGSHAGGCSGHNGKSHAALNDLALFLTLPNVSTWAPADRADVRFAIARILADGAPAYVRLPRPPVGVALDLPGEEAPVRRIGPARRTMLVSTGLGSHLAVAAQTQLRDGGVEVGVLHVLELTATTALAAALSDATELIVVEDHVSFGGLGSLVRATAPAARICEVGWPRDWTGQSGADHQIQRELGLAVEPIARLVAQRAVSA